MLHTLLITKEILKTDTYNEIYKSLELISKNNGEELYKEKKSTENKQIYTTHALKNIGFSRITLIKKKINPKYKYPVKQIEIQLNPTKLLNKENLVELTLENDISEFERRFNEEIAKIHIKLPTLYYWILNRIDYAVNISTPYVDQYIRLFQRGDIPYPFEEVEDKKAKRKKQSKGSLYLKSVGVNINFYDKEAQTMNSGNYREGSKNILRLEVQCKRGKTNSLKYKHEFIIKYLGYFLSKEMSDEIIAEYYNKTVGAGDYYTLGAARKIVDSSNLNSNMKQKLIEVLETVNECRRVATAREVYIGEKKCKSFNTYLKKLRALNINPVTIPERWPVKYLQNVMNIN